MSPRAHNVARHWYAFLIALVASVAVGDGVYAIKARVPREEAGGLFLAVSEVDPSFSDYLDALCGDDFRTLSYKVYDPSYGSYAFERALQGYGMNDADIFILPISKIDEARLDTLYLSFGETEYQSIFPGAAEEEAYAAAKDGQARYYGVKAYDSDTGEGILLDYLTYPSEDCYLLFSALSPFVDEGGAAYRLASALYATKGGGE